MRKELKIGNIIFRTKKEALAFYGKILNSYDFFETLSKQDFDSIIDLLDYDYLQYESETNVDNQDDILDQEIDEFLEIVGIKVSQVQHHTKCFELIFSEGEGQYISYIHIINRYKPNPLAVFSRACGELVAKDLRSVKQVYFDNNSVKGMVKCQETGVLSYWLELHVNHRQPNTFSVIIDRFIELNSINVNKIDYSVADDNTVVITDQELMENFRKYHKDKAALRIARKELNLSRSDMAKIKIQKKDLRIE